MGTWVSENTNPAYVDTSEDIVYLKLAFAISILYFTIAGTTKLGVLLMYHRIFYVSTLFRYQLFITGSLVIAFWIGCTVAAFTNCIPLEWSWLNSLADPRYCFNYNIFWTAAGACEIVLDALILLLPISTVLRMMLSLREKLIVVGIFLLGGFVIVTGILKVYMGYVPGGRVPSYSKTELWSTVHTGMSIVCASLPIFKPLFMRIAKSPFIVKLSTIIGARYSIKGSSRSWSFHFKSPKASSNESRDGGRRGSAPGDMMMARGHHPPLLDNNSRRYDSAIERAVEEGLARILPPRELEEQQSETEMMQKSVSNSKLPPLETSDSCGLLDDIQRALQERENAG